jgi:hypothetical protein
MNISTVSSHVQIRCHIVIYNGVSEKNKKYVLLNRIENALNERFGYL